MKNTLLIIMAFTAVASQASLVLYDYTDAPIEASISVVQGGTETGTASLFLSLSGADLEAGELEISLYASAVKNSEEAYVQMGSGFKTAVLNDLIGLTTIFTQGVEDLIAISGKNGTASYDAYLGLEFDAGNGDHYYGWAKVRADASQIQSSKTTASSFSVSTLAYNNTANESIVVGAIPEPAVASLVILFGAGVLATRRIFTK